MKNYHFYMQATTKAGVGTGAVKDLEVDFPGLHYVSCEGLEDVGKPKNIYSENYPEADGLRTYHPADSSDPVTHEATKVTLTLLFLNVGRRDVYNSFRAFVDGSRVFYWDTARNKKVWLMFDNEAKPDDDTLPPDGYIKVPFVFTNLWGKGKKCNDNGTVL